MSLEIRRAGTLEYRRALRRLSGVVMPYGEISTRADNGREMFLPGSLTPVGDPYLNVMHLNGQDGKANVTLMRQSDGLAISQSPERVEIEATMPETREAQEVIELIEAGMLKGLSLEFNALEEETLNGVRVVRRAELAGVGIVDNPAYTGAALELRNGRRKLWL